MQNTQKIKKYDFSEKKKRRERAKEKVEGGRRPRFRENRELGGSSGQ